MQAELQAFVELAKSSSEGASYEPNNRPRAEGALVAGGGGNRRKGENKRKGKYS